MRTPTIDDAEYRHPRLHAGYATDEVDLFVQAVQDAVCSHRLEERVQRLEGP
jgi:hypothetical protein